MRILVIGLGDIARKAYLPVLVATPGLHLHLVTRDAAALQALGERFRIDDRSRHLDDVNPRDFDAAFVHAATAAHGEIVERLLRSGLPVFVDKPLADTFAEASHLVDVAMDAGRLLAVGFNRRFAPDYVAMRSRPRSLILLQKHRRASPDEIRRVIFDDFIHAVDTLRFLTPAPILRETIETVVRGHLLESVVLTLAGDGYCAVAAMHRASGLDEERLDIFGGDRKRSSVNLADTVVADGDDRTTRRGDWTSVGEQRGFDAMCADFLTGVRERRVTDPAEVLETHAICERIVEHALAHRAAG